MNLTIRNWPIVFVREPGFHTIVSVVSPVPKVGIIQKTWTIKMETSHIIIHLVQRVKYASARENRHPRGKETRREESVPSTNK